jgi:exopolysaccharide biosynthesis polyprenyl glycosylphosphotransferase
MKTFIDERTQIRSKPLKSLMLSQKSRNQFIFAGLLISDFLVIGLSFLVAYIIRFLLLPYTAPYSISTYNSLVRILLPLWILIFAAFQLYNQHYLFGGLSEYARIFNAISFGVVVVIALAFFKGDELIISRGWLLISWWLALSFVMGERFLIRRFIYSMRKHGYLLSPTLVIGANNEGRAVAGQLHDWSTSGLEIAGFVDQNIPVGTPVENGYSVLGGIQDLDRLIEEYQIQEIIIAPASLSNDQLLCVFQEYSTRPNIQIRLSSGLFEILTTGLRIKEIAFVPLIEINEARISGLDAFMKTLMDYCLVIPGLILISPILLLIAILIKIDSPGPVIFRRRVMGLNGQQFDAFKFRTMSQDGNEILADRPDLQAELANHFKLKDDPRITRVGAFLRKYSLDELLQLFNVLLGQMSLVGPRMISPPEMEKYGKWGMNLLTVKPGITGMWQVSGRSDVSYEERVRLDMFYIRNWTVWLDLFLLFKTPPAVFQKKGAY